MIHRGYLVFLVICVLWFPVNSEDVIDDDENSVNVKNKRLLPIVNIVRFDNSPCEGGNSRNGTCYTKAECESKGGSHTNTCASSFGVCCVFELTCGQSSSDNCTYIVHKSSDTIDDMSCPYKICKCNDNICRIRFDFTMFQIADPVAFVASSQLTNGAVGDCATDRFTITSNGPPIPTICGFNTGQHMIVEANEECNEAVFSLASSSTATRNWDIKVTQYECNDHNGGPMECLQYFTADTGDISSYNFNSGTTVTATNPHLSDQKYTACFRRTAGKCKICFTPTITAGVQSFGLSVSPSTTVPQSAISTNCLTDFIQILGGRAVATASTAAPIAERFCGRFLNTANGLTASVSICTFTTPFRLTFCTDGDEAGGNGNADSKVNESYKTPSGSVGFKLTYTQVAC